MFARWTVVVVRWTFWSSHGAFLNHKLNPVLGRRISMSGPECHSRFPSASIVSASIWQFPPTSGTQCPAETGLFIKLPEPATSPSMATMNSTPHSTLSNAAPLPICNRISRTTFATPTLRRAVKDSQPCHRSPHHHTHLIPSPDFCNSPWKHWKH